MFKAFVLIWIVYGAFVNDSLARSDIIDSRFNWMHFNGYQWRESRWKSIHQNQLRNYWNFETSAHTHARKKHLFAWSCKGSASFKEICIWRQPIRNVLLVIVYNITKPSCEMVRSSSSEFRTVNSIWTAKMPTENRK